MSLITDCRHFSVDILLSVIFVQQLYCLKLVVTFMLQYSDDSCQFLTPYNVSVHFWYTFYMNSKKKRRWTTVPQLIPYACRCWTSRKHYFSHETTEINLQKFYNNAHKLVDRKDMSVSQFIRDLFSEWNLHAGRYILSLRLACSCGSS